MMYSAANSSPERVAVSHLARSKWRGLHYCFLKKGLQGFATKKKIK